MNLTIAEIDALPVGSVIYDSYGHQLIRREHETRPWIYTRLLTHHAAEEIGTDHPRAYGPYTLHAGLTQEELDAVPVGFKIQDKDGDQLTRRRGGYTYTRVLEMEGAHGANLLPVYADLWPAPFTMAPLTTEELEALPDGSRIKDADGDELTKRGDCYSYTESLGRLDRKAFPMKPAYLVSGPHTLVSVGEVAQ